jgi:hypothetical protein
MRRKLHRSQLLSKQENNAAAPQEIFSSLHAYGDISPYLTGSAAILSLPPHALTAGNK